MNFLDPKKIILLSSISPGLRVADFETGGGHFAIEAAKHLKNEGVLYCIGSRKDMLTRTLKEANKIGIKNLEIAVGHIEKDNGVPLEDGTLDLVMIENTMFALSKRDECARESYRLLARGGRVLFVEWLDSFNGLGPSKNHLVSKKDAREMFKDAGFDFVKEIDAGNYHYAFIFRKN